VQHARRRWKDRSRVSHIHLFIIIDADYVQFLGNFAERFTAKKKVDLDELVKQIEEKSKNKAASALAIQSTPLTEFMAKGNSKKSSSATKERAKVESAQSNEKSSRRGGRRERSERKGDEAKEDRSGKTLKTEEPEKKLTILRKTDAPVGSNEESAKEIGQRKPRREEYSSTHGGSSKKSTGNKQGEPRIRKPESRTIAPEASLPENKESADRVERPAHQSSPSQADSKRETGRGRGSRSTRNKVSAD